MNMIYLRRGALLRALANVTKEKRIWAFCVVLSILGFCVSAYAQVPGLIAIDNQGQLYRYNRTTGQISAPFRTVSFSKVGCAFNWGGGFWGLGYENQTFYTTCSGPNGGKLVRFGYNNGDETGIPLTYHGTGIDQITSFIKDPADPANKFFALYSYQVPSGPFVVGHGYFDVSTGQAWSSSTDGEASFVPCSDQLSTTAFSNTGRLYQAVVDNAGTMHEMGGAYASYGSLSFPNRSCVLVDCAAIGGVTDVYADGGMALDSTSGEIFGLGTLGQLYRSGRLPTNPSTYCTGRGTGTQTWKKFALSTDDAPKMLGNNTLPSNTFTKGLVYGVDNFPGHPPDAGTRPWTPIQMLLDQQ